MFLFTIFPIIIIFGIIAYLVYMGAFLPIQFEEKTVGPYNFIYKEVNNNDFSLIGKTTSEINTLLGNYNFSNIRPMQIFYPKAENRTTEVGFLVNEKVNDLPGLLTKSLPSSLCITTTFPWRNSLSFIFGFMKVDPALKNYVVSKSYKNTEVRVILENDTINYQQTINPNKG